MSIWILNKIIYENSLISHNVLTDYHKTNPLSWGRSCYWWSWAWCRPRRGFRRETTEKIIFCRWFLCWSWFRCSRITNLYILKNLSLWMLIFFKLTVAIHLFQFVTKKVFKQTKRMFGPVGSAVIVIKVVIWKFWTKPIFYLFWYVSRVPLLITSGTMTINSHGTSCIRCIWLKAIGCLKWNVNDTSFPSKNKRRNISRHSSISNLCIWKYK